MNIVKKLCVIGLIVIVMLGISSLTISPRTHARLITKYSRLQRAVYWDTSTKASRYCESWLPSINREHRNIVSIVCEKKEYFVDHVARQAKAAYDSLRGGVKGIIYYDDVIGTWSFYTLTTLLPQDD